MSNGVEEEKAEWAAALAAEFAAAHYDDVLRYCRRRLSSWDDAQDAVQEVFLRLVRSGALYERRGKPLAYLYTIARNVCAEAHRRRARSWGRSTWTCPTPLPTAQLSGWCWTRC